MKLTAYENLFLVNQGYDQVARSLKALAQHSPLERSEIRRFKQMTAEACAGTGSGDREHVAGRYSRRTDRQIG